MALARWAVPVGLGVLTILGCNGHQAEQIDAAGDTMTPPIDAMVDAPDAMTMPPVDNNLPPEPMIPAVCPGATLDALHAVRATGDAKTDGLPIYSPAALDTAAIQAAIDACGASLTAGQ